MLAPAPLTTSVAPARHEPPAAPTRPSLRTIVRHLAASLFTATVVPSVLFYCCLLAGNVWTALISALVWCYGAVAWRLRTKRRTSMLLWLTVTGLTVKSTIAFATGSTFVYFVQPALVDGAIALVFLVSLATAKPAVARLAADFYPMDADVAGRPRVQRLFWRLTLFWAAMCAVKAVVTVWMLQELSLPAFVAAKSVFMPTSVLLGAAITVALATRVARREGLFHASQTAVVATAAA